MAAAKEKRRQSTGMTIPVAALAGFVPLAFSIRDNGFAQAGNTLVSNLTGYDINQGAWHWQNMKHGTIPIILGMVAHKFIGGALGVNRLLARARVPLIRI